MKFKNNTEIVDSWVGQQIQPGEYYQVSNSELPKWQDDLKVITDITNSTLIINDNISDITDVVKAINYLKDVDSSPKDSSGSTIVRQRPFADTDGFNFSGNALEGIAVKTTNTNIDFTLSEELYLNGGQLIIKHGVDGDYLKFQVLAPNDYVVNQFVHKWFINANNTIQPALLLSYPAKIPAGFKIRLVYTSLGTENDVDVKCNLYLHKKVA